MRKKTITYNPKHYKSGMASVVYKDKNTKIREKKVVETKKKIKTVKYSPINYYGKQTKTKTKVRK